MARGDKIMALTAREITKLEAQAARIRDLEAWLKRYKEEDGFMTLEDRLEGYALAEPEKEKK